MHLLCSSITTLGFQGYEDRSLPATYFGFHQPTVVLLELNHHKDGLSDAKRKGLKEVEENGGH